MDIQAYNKATELLKQIDEFKRRKTMLESMKAITGDLNISTERGAFRVSLHGGDKIHILEYMMDRTDKEIEALEQQLERL